ncbi:hypothetical protein BaRGS_00029788, partial [Batillaria attramentaria]
MAYTACHAAALTVSVNRQRVISTLFAENIDTIKHSHVNTTLRRHTCATYEGKSDRYFCKDDGETSPTTSGQGLFALDTVGDRKVSIGQEGSKTVHCLSLPEGLLP